MFIAVLAIVSVPWRWDVAICRTDVSGDLAVVAGLQDEVNLELIKIDKLLSMAD